MNIIEELKQRFRVVLLDLAEDDVESLLEQIRPAQAAKFGDYQANFAMWLGKRLGRSPRELAGEIAARLTLDDFCQRPEVAGPGFINLRLKDEWLSEQLGRLVGDERLGVPPVKQPRTIIIDYSAPNVAKPMHVGHVRSTVIGDALCRVLRFLGHRVISDNHIGDWGTQFGMILYGWRHFRDEEAYRQNPVAELARLYRHVRKLMEAEKSGKEEEEGEADDSAGAVGPVTAAVLAETAKLHAGDAESRRLWAEFMPHCLREIEQVYRRLEVKFDYTLGESFYHDQLHGLVEELLQKKIAQESEGAVGIFLEGHRAPMLLRKKDGAFLYATTDLATLRYRIERWRPDVILYVVDHRQTLHFQQLFAAARLLGYDKVDLRHISFGTMLGEDGRPFRTRSGETVALEELLEEAVSRAMRIVSENDDAKPEGPELSLERRREIAETIGVAALKYADLSQNRVSDYVFSFDKMLAMNGNTATYMQYAYARVRSIFSKGNVNIERLRAARGKIFFSSPVERALGLALLRFPEALDMTAADYRPNQLTSYLFSLAEAYAAFFEQCPVLRAETEPLRQSRLLLCDLTARIIQKGLELLGIKVVEKM